MTPLRCVTFIQKISVGQLGTNLQNCRYTPIEFTFVRRQGAQGVVYHHEYSTDLSAWGSAEVIVTSTTPNGDGTETVTIRLTFPVDAPASGTRYYLRTRAGFP